MQKIFIKIIFTGLLGLLSISAFSSITVIKHSKPISDSDRMFTSLLRLIVLKADPAVKFIEAERWHTDERSIADLERGALSLIWTMTSIDYEQRMLPIRYPVEKGLLGYRIFLIKQGTQHKFDGIETLAQLRHLAAGQGHTWGDTSILRHSNLSVVTTTKPLNLYPMLDGGRFDYFPRGVFEAWDEINIWSKYNFVVEKNILLQYPTAVYFFVRKDNHQLANLLIKGFEKALADGSYDQFFYSSKPVVEAIDLGNLLSRKVIKLPNPLLPSDTPLDRPELWFDINRLKQAKASAQ